MNREIEVQGIRIYTKAVPCAHACAYCLVGPKKLTDIPFSRFYTLAERFIEWRKGEPSPLPQLWIGFEDSFEFDVEILAGLFRLYKQLGWGDEGMGVKLGGLRMRPEDEMRAWLRARRDVAGLKTVHGSLVGHGATHDRWNRRKGDSEFLLRTMKNAVELGLQVNQRIFVVKSTLASIDKLVFELDKISPNARRYRSIFVYSGFAARLEDERITEEIRDCLPASVAALPVRDHDDWLSEREWIRERGHIIADERPRGVVLDLEVNEKNIDKFERIGCEEIVAGLTNITQKYYDALPSRSELFDKYSDASNRRIYGSVQELEQKWFDVYRRTYGR